MFKTKERKTKTDRQKAEVRCDDLYSEYIRKRAMMFVGGCQRCHSPRFDIQKDNGSIFPAWKQLDCGHCHGRGKHTVRWDPRNAAGICGGCHKYIDAQIIAKEELFRRLLGEEEYERLYVLAEMTTKSSPIDYNLIELYLKQLLKEVYDGMAKVSSL